ncbi:MAG: hypothetical protein M3069_25770 [Chloroflexota bacterium]|nr:hypothetical protein [Chloroflexota bacterium]
MTSETTIPSEPTRRAERREEVLVVRFPSPRRFLRAILPEQAVQHLYAAQREQLLAVRSILDAAIERVDEAATETTHH